MKKFEDLVFKQTSDGLGGVHALIQFENGFGASVVCSPFSYGGRNGLYELAVLDEDGGISYDTPITSDVLGYLHESEVTDALVAIQRLPKSV